MPLYHSQTRRHTCMINLFLFSEIQNRPSYEFSVLWIANTDPSVNDALKFTRVLLNDNAVYNANTGEFKAPVDGTYLLTASVCIYSGKYLKLQFMADDTVIGSFIAGDVDWASCTASTAISQLQKGHTVKLVVVQRHGSGDIVVNSDTGYLSSFAGTLLKQ